MIIRSYGKIIFVCDFCSGTILETDTDDFKKAFAIMLDAGWNAREWPRGSGKWKHSCVECAQ